MARTSTLYVAWSVKRYLIDDETNLFYAKFLISRDVHLMRCGEIKPDQYWQKQSIWHTWWPKCELKKIEISKSRKNKSVIMNTDGCLDAGSTPNDTGRNLLFTSRRHIFDTSLTLPFSFSCVSVLLFQFQSVLCLAVIFILLCGSLVGYNLPDRINSHLLELLYYHVHTHTRT